MKPAGSRDLAHRRPKGGEILNGALALDRKAPPVTPEGSSPPVGDMDHQIRSALSRGGVFDSPDEYPVRYVVMAETIRYDDTGTAHRRVYKIASPDATCSGNRELLTTGLAMISRRTGNRLGDDMDATA